MFGDFKIDNIPENSGTYNVEITFRSNRKKQIVADVSNSVSLGTIILPEFCTQLALNGHRGQIFQDDEEFVFFSIA
jgi:hypothetical protein